MVCNDYVRRPILDMRMDTNAQFDILFILFSLFRVDFHIDCTLEKIMYFIDTETT